MARLEEAGLSEPAPIGWRFDAPGRDPQAQADVAVIIGTVLRPSLLAALESVYRQDLRGTLQVLVGVDKAVGAIEPLLGLLERRPPHVGALVFHPGYSTAKRHGGVHEASDGGALRSILGYLANSPRLCYLDDDNQWLPGHLSSLARAIEGHAWAYSLRTFVDQESGRDLCVDEWDSVGPGKGLHRETLGGFVDLNCLMIDKTRAEEVLALWTQPQAAARGTADRRVFQALNERHPGTATGLATVRYSIRRSFYLWPKIRERLREQARDAR